MKFDLKKELFEAVKDIDWNFRGILDTDNRLHEIPKNLNFQALFERLVMEKLQVLTKKYKIKVIDPDSIRAYPDIILEDGILGDKVIAVDIKTGRRKGNRTGFTLGSYAGYFRNPDKKCSGCVVPYNKFFEHWAICFIYDWNPDNDTLGMISNIQIVVQEKWKLASKSTGTGTTTAIGSIKNISDVISGKSIFKNEREFSDYWKNFSRPNKK